MRDAFRTPALSKNPLPTYVGGLALLAISACGFWLWAPEQAGGQSYLLGLGFVPLVLFLALVVRAVTGIDRDSLSTGDITRIDQLQKRLNAQDDFMRAITHDAPSAMTLFDNSNQYWFVNASAAAGIGYDSAAIIGKTPVALLGAEEGRKIERSLDQVRQSNKPLDVLKQKINDRGEVIYIQAHYEPMPVIGAFSGGVIAREENITTLITEREHSETVLRQVITTLVGVVDRRDPYASGHSMRTGILSRALAAEMQLSERDIETAEMAGSLMNFGKVLISRSILTKTGALSQDELQRIRDGIMTSADIVAQIDFGMPVVPTLRQALERVDGTGVPDGLKGDEILVTARIVAVANAFIALVSPRAYRAGIDLLAAADRLAQEAGTVFDTRVIAALQDYLRKNPGKLGWLTVVKSI